MRICVLLGGAFVGKMKEADSGDSGSASFQTGGCILKGHAAQRVDRDGSRCGTGGAQLVEALTGKFLAVREGLLEDGGKEDRIDMVMTGTMNLGESVAGHGNQGIGTTGEVEKDADLRRGEFVGRSG